jgi:hypothetical protein
MDEVETLLRQVVGAVIAEVGPDWERMKDFAEHEFRVLALTAVEIKRRQALGTITEKKAARLMRAHKNAVESVVLAIQGVALVMLEKAINAAIRVVSGFVRAATGWNVFGVLPG